MPDRTPVLVPIVRPVRAPPLIGEAVQTTPPGDEAEKVKATSPRSAKLPSDPAGGSSHTGAVSPSRRVRLKKRVATPRCEVVARTPKVTRVSAMTAGVVPVSTPEGESVK